MKTNSGFTLIEVLVAMLVLAFGLIGLAGLQVSSLRDSQRAFYRSQATQLAYDVADRMRANNNPAVMAIYTRADPTAAVSKPACLTTAGCSSADMAENDLFEWVRDVRTILPSGIGIITRGAGPNSFDIDISWDGDRDADDSNNRHFFTSFQL